MIARQKETALGSIQEVVQTVERPRAKIQSSKTEIQETIVESPLADSAAKLSMNTPGRETPLFDPTGELARTSSSISYNAKSRKSIRSSLMG